MNSKYFLVGCAWVVTGVVVVIGLKITKNANCLWALALPALIS